MAIGQDITSGIQSGSAAFTRGFSAGTQAKMVQANIDKQKQQEFMTQLQNNLKLQSQAIAQAKHSLDVQTDIAIKQVPQKYKEDQQQQAVAALENQYQQNLQKLQQQAIQIFHTQYAPLIAMGTKMGYITDPNTAQVYQQAFLSSVSGVRPSQQSIVDAAAAEQKASATAIGQGGVMNYTLNGKQGSVMKGDTARIQQLTAAGAQFDSGGGRQQLWYNTPPTAWEKQGLGALASLGERINSRTQAIYSASLDNFRQDNPEISPQDAAKAFVASKNHSKAYALSKAAWTDSGKMGMWATSANKLTAHLGLLTEAAKTLDPTSAPGINSIVNMYRTQTGDNSVTNFETLRAAIANEYAKMLHGSGTVAETDVQRQYDNIMSKGSLPQLIGAIGGMKHILSEQVNATYIGYKNAREGIDKNIRSEYEKHFDPELIRLIDEKQAKTPASGITLPTITTQEQYDKLKSGDIYLGADGNKYRKP